MTFELNKKILMLLKVPGMGRKTVHSILINNDISRLEIEDICSVINGLAKNNSRIKSVSESQLRNYYSEAGNILSIQEDANIHAINFNDEEYPDKFKELDNPPVILFLRGDKTLLEGKNHIGIIGTRDATENGLSAGKRLAGILSGKGEIIVSGLAVGCDTSGHLGCLESNGKTIAILPSPITNIMPKSNRNIAEQIVENGGLLISEYYYGQEIQRGYYVDRDRLQSALSDALVVIETDIEGGTMHTVNFGLKLGRLIACYNHPQKFLGCKQSRGNQKLIAESGAIPLGSNEDVEIFEQKLAEYRNNKDININQQIRFDI